ncbi:hypothetical protein VC83_09536 [Pseudogymnoascus destructans]|uniref:Uncharacterized protein n=1 Tax=Pseudogymnoascus destructans TaxID=655981 RepID=A0A176ZW97_9PEZI|nr:uncharacterized protein VC83_09536 [Pseudogymnoascus destructans]OAF54179.1 hypothetical protein VC83_09536 [Pseudogymnoascus destructans]
MDGGDATPGQEAKVTEADVFNMSGDMLDRYLNWYHQTWSGERDSKATPVSERLRRVQSRLKVQKPISANDEQYVATINRPGAFYKRWQRDGDLSANERAFVAKTAENAGTTVNILIRTVYSLEQRLHDIASREGRPEVEH